MDFKKSNFFIQIRWTYKILKNIFQNIKDSGYLKDLVHYYRLYVNRGGFACCPFHDERTPSFKVYTKMLKFIIGMITGGTVGFFVSALLVAAKKGDGDEIW